MQLTFETRQLDALDAALAAAPEITQAEFRVFVTETVAHLQGEVVQRTPTSGAGMLRGSIIGNVRPLQGLGVEGVIGTPLPYAPAVEDGSRPHFPPIAPLADCARRKLGVSEAEANSVGFLIARKIARVGTEGAFMFRDALAANEAQILTRLD